MTDTENPHNRPRPSVRRLALLLIAAAAVLGAGVYGVIGTQGKPVTAPAAPAAIPVRTMTVEPKKVEVTRAGLGTVTAWQMANITLEVSGRIIALPFREGQAVREGDILVRIDPRPFQAALDQAKAKKDQDIANLGNVKANLTRDQTLIAKGGFASQPTVDNEKAQVQVLNATIEGDQSAIEAAQLNLDFATLKAPFPGVVGLRSIDLGNLVTPSTSIGTHRTDRTDRGQLHAASSRSAGHPVGRRARQARRSSL